MGIDVTATTRIMPLKRGTLTADGAEQILIEHVQRGRIVGYVDLQNMQVGDTLVIRQYMKLRPDGAFKMYAEEAYGGVQTVPLIYIRPKESDFGVRVTFQQTAGVMRTYDYDFLREV